MHVEQERSLRIQRLAHVYGSGSSVWLSVSVLKAWVPGFGFQGRELGFRVLDFEFRD